MLAGLGNFFSVGSDSLVADDLPGKRNFATHVELFSGYGDVVLKKYALALAERTYLCGGKGTS